MNIPSTIKLPGNNNYAVVSPRMRHPEKQPGLLPIPKLERLKAINPTRSVACNACELALICQGGCPMANIWQTGFPPSKSAFTCAVEKRLTPKLLLDIAMNPVIKDTVLYVNALVSECDFNIKS